MNPISFSAEAADKLLDNLAEYRMDYPDAGLRVGIKGGGCSGLTYEMDLSLGGSKPRDLIFEAVPGLRVFVDPISLQYLKGTRIGFGKTGLVEGFTFDNPNAERTCGCGSSFSA